MKKLCTTVDDQSLKTTFYSAVKKEGGDEKLFFINKYKDTGEKIAEEYDIFENPDLDNLNLQRTPSGDVFDMSKPNDPPMTHFEPGQRKGFKDFVAKLLLGLY